MSISRGYTASKRLQQDYRSPFCNNPCYQQHFAHIYHKKVKKLGVYNLCEAGGRMDGEAIQPVAASLME